MISDEAVEAAISVFPWQAADYLDTDTVRAALEAAAPHMLAGGWNRKLIAGVLAEHQIEVGNRGMTPRCTCGWLGQVFGNDFHEDFITHQADMVTVSNPYRSQA